MLATLRHGRYSHHQHLWNSRLCGHAILCVWDADQWVTLSTKRPIKTLETHFANCAYLEAASVDAFIELAEIANLGALPILIQRCLIAAEEERNHTQLMDGLATSTVVIDQSHLLELQSNTSLFEVALHNAVEGCIHEAWAQPVC